ncbi:MAG TPA: acetyl-CoA carboxylase carboxyltransferase subunit alpha [Planctomycetota bacterium]
MAKDSRPAAGASAPALPFEKPIEDVRQRLAELEELASRTSQDLVEEIDFYRARLDRLTREVYASITPWQRVQVARHADRPLTGDYIESICDDWVELHGDGAFADDRAVVTGLARIGERPVMLVGHRKGRTTKERMACNFGSAHPEGYRKALRKMRLAERMGLPIVCLVNTPGAYPGVGAEERGQARAIAENIVEMFGIRVPIVVLVIGEGGSGGALGIAIGDRVGMMENSWYSVISPEGCASILWRSADRKEEAAAALKLTATDLLGLGIVDDVVREPLGGAHRDPEAAMAVVRERIGSWLDELAQIPIERLLSERHAKFRKIAQLAAGQVAAAPAAAASQASPDKQRLDSLEIDDLLSRPRPTDNGHPTPGSGQGGGA